MKKVIRLLALMLAICMLPLALIACNNESDGEEEVTVANDSPIEQKNYSDKFNYLVLNDTFTFEYFYAEERLYNEMNDSIYERQLNVEGNLGIDVTARKSEDFQGYSQDFTTSITAQDNTYQLCLTHATTGVAPLATMGYLYDFKKLESVDLGQKYWNKRLMSTVQYNNQYLLGYGDMCLASVNTIAFNKDLLTKNCSNVLGDDSIYTLVEDNKWTLSKLGELAAAAHEDLNGGNKDAGDQYGLTGMFWVEACSFLHSSNVNISRYNSEEKKYELCINNNNNKTQKVIEKVAELYNAEYSYFSVPDTFPGNHEAVQMKSGRTLFELTKSYKLIELKGTNITFGVLPYPLYDENQENYRSLSWNGYMVVPYNIDVVSNVEMVSDTLELLQYYSKPVTTAFYEKLLGAQVSESPDDAYMLEIIWASQVSDFAMAYSDTTAAQKPLDALLYTVPRVVLRIDNTSNFAGYYAKWGRNAEKQIKDVQNPKQK